MSPANGTRVARLIAVEEHFLVPELAKASRLGRPEPESGRIAAIWDAKMSDLGEGRLQDLDAAAIDVQVLSHTAPGPQVLKGADAIALSRETNDRLAAAIARNPDRFAGFAMLPSSEPEAAAEELRRAVSELGFVGGMIHGTTGGLSLDDSRFEPILAEAERLETVLYLHPALPPPAVHETYFAGLPAQIGMLLAGPVWGWHQETALHALRMIVAGCFDRHPQLKVVIGHMGEMLPFQLARIDQLLSPAMSRMDRRVSDYVLANFWLTTSGFFTEPPLLCALSTVGADRILFSVDYPFSSNQAGRAYIESVSIGEIDRDKLAFGNAERLLGIA